MLQTTVEHKNFRLHRFILERQGITIPKIMVVDHINNDKLDNTRKNLRIITRSENARNKLKQTATSSKYIGVSFHKISNN
ncbi:HNH endonuclease [bacterium]|nr:HNH endonuclease [bacterium]